MAFDRKLLANKLEKYRNQFQLTFLEVSESTGIAEDRLISFEQGVSEPSGDEILILADCYKCDYKFFVSNERLAPFEQTDELFRRFGNEFAKADRWAVQEFLYLAECESFLEVALNKQPKNNFSFNKVGSYFKTHGKDAAAALRKHFSYSFNEVHLDVYAQFRRLGIHLFRRKLQNSNISGLFVKHPVAGHCVLINYNEDIYRQRFTAAHEAGHSILDGDESLIVSLKKDRTSLVETRANAFASHFLMPPEFLLSIPSDAPWLQEKAVIWSSRLKVSTEALAYALKDAGLIDDMTVANIKRVRVPKNLKEDPELPSNLSSTSKIRKEELLGRGLSSYYVGLCFEGYRENIITGARLAEMLLVDTDFELRELAALYNEALVYDN